MIDDTLKKRGQVHLICNQPLRPVKKVKSRVTGSTKVIERDNSNVLLTQSSSSRRKTASNPPSREGVKRDSSNVLTVQPSSSRPKIASHPHVLGRGADRENSKVLPTQVSSRPKAAFDPYFREGDKRKNSDVVPMQLSSSRPRTSSYPHALNREEVKHGNSEVLTTETAFDPYFNGAKRVNSEVPPTQPSSSRSKTASDPHLIQGARSSSVPSSSTSTKGRPTLTPAPRKRPSDTPDSAMKKQKTGKYPGCPACGGPHHLVKDCPITAEPKRYVFLVSDFMTPLLIISWIVYALPSSNWSLNQSMLSLSLLSVTF